MNLFDYAASYQERVSGIEQVMSSYDADQWALDAMQFAFQYAARHGEVSSDTIQKYRPPPTSCSPNVMGGFIVRLSKKMKFVRYERTARRSGHARRISVWSLKDHPVHERLEVWA